MIYPRQTESTGAPPAATPPSSNSGEVPKLGGSSAGYIVLVVGFAAIVIACCAATFFLLRGHKVDPFEHHARRVLAGKREATLYEMPLGPQGIRQKFKRFFTFGRKRDGWIKANSGDDGEWDASDRLVYDHPREAEDSDERWTLGSGVHEPSQPRALQEERSYPIRSETSDSIELTAPPISPLPQTITPSLMGGPSSYRPHIEYASSFAAESAVAPSDVVRAPGNEGGQDINRFQVLSDGNSGRIPIVRSMRKFESGTKFKEGLDF